MRGPLHGYYGITSALPISSGLPTFMIVSGVTTKSAEAEYCLMAKTLRRGSSVIVDLCSAALSQADGRDLWQLNPSNQLIAAYTYPSLCLDQNLILGSCDIVRSVDFVGNSQINLLWLSEKCLSFDGESVGMEDMIISMNPLSEASSVLSIGHSAASGISQDTRSYWSSAAFDSPAERQVTFDIDFTSAVNISRVIIDWEYPPLR